MYWHDSMRRKKRDAAFSLLLSNENTDQDPRQQHHPGQQPSTQGLSGSPRSCSAVAPKNLGKAVLESRRRETERITCQQRVNFKSFQTHSKKIRRTRTEQPWPNIYWQFYKNAGQWKLKGTVDPIIEILPYLQLTIRSIEALVTLSDPHNNFGVLKRERISSNESLLWRRTSTYKQHSKNMFPYLFVWRQPSIQKTQQSGLSTETLAPGLEPTYQLQSHRQEVRSHQLSHVWYVSLYAPETWHTCEN